MGARELRASQVQQVQRLLARLKEERDRWTAPDKTKPAWRLAMLKPAPEDRYEMIPIAGDVWKRRDGPKAVEPVGTPGPPGGKPGQSKLPI